MLKSLIFVIVSFCGLSASTGNLTTARDGTYNLKNAENETEKAYPNCQCLNGYCELNADYDYVCKCPEEYGLITSTECERCYCGVGANCTFLKDWSSYEKTCVCKKGYKDVAGICTVVCDNEFCSNRGTCSIELEGPKCTCLSPNFGDRCEKVPCTSNNCNYRGTCFMEDYEMKCLCDKPYYGDACDKVECDDEYCNYRGTCSSIFGEPTCSCESKYSGDHCEKDPCEPNPCKNGGTCYSMIENSFSCFCTSSYIGDRCQVKLDDTTTSYQPDYFFIQIIGYVGVVLLILSCSICLACLRYRRKNNTTYTAAVVASPICQNQYEYPYQPPPHFPAPPPPYFEQHHDPTSSSINANIAPPVTVSQPAVVASPVHQNQYEHQPLPHIISPPPPQQHHDLTSNKAYIAPPTYQKF